MIFHRGTLEEFNIWHDAVKIAEGYPKIGYINGIPAPQNQKTVAYSAAVSHPSNINDYIWADGKYPRIGHSMLSLEEVKVLGWFPVIGL